MELPIFGKVTDEKGNHIVRLSREIKEDYDYNEAIKTFRTNIQFCGSSVRTVMCTSAMPDEGKSDISFALAQSLAQISRRTLLIDTDIRKSVLVTRYHLEQEVSGLSQYLSGQKSIADIIYETNQENLSVIFAGPYSPNPAELLEEPLFGELLAYAREHYDYVVLDTAPLGGLIDAAIVARHCDGAVMVIEADAISRRLEQRVKDQLEKSGCRILGVVLNKVNIHHNRYYGKYGKYGHYGKYSKYSSYGQYGKDGVSGKETGKKTAKKKEAGK
ncbi:MAG: CpsD/CapB family tyrosine-protein kinase [Clostridiales bacterium]|nr:CpsD/CapB family tyrosine-protein kinase [Clostridiales bacterium]